MKYVGKLFGQIGRTRGYFDLGKTSEDWDALETRAERAEASLHALRLICGTTDADKFSTWVDRANTRAEKAEAELAAERARLDWLMAGGVCMVQHAGGFHVSRLHAPVSRAHIDAAMKEETK